MTKTLAILVGSLRKESINLKLAQALAKLGENNFKSTILRIDDLPMYNQDLESDLPASVVRFKSDLKSTDALLVLTPEYNRAMPGVLKNALDWAARPYGQNSISGKPAAVSGASPGAIGTAAAQQQLKTLLNNMNTVLMGQPEAYIHYKPDMVGADGNVADDATRGFLQKFMDSFAAWAQKHG